MFEIRREPAKPVQIDPTKLRWGEDRREADAFIITQLTHMEKKQENIAGFIVIFAISYFSYHEGYKFIAFGLVLIMFLWMIHSGSEYNTRQEKITKLMDRNWDKDFY